MHLPRLETDMRSYRISQVGSLDDLKTVEEAIPVPGPGQVRVRVRASALNFRDLALLTGMFPVPVKADVVPRPMRLAKSRRWDRM